VKRVRLDFAGLKVEFCDRERAIQQVEEFAERGTWHSPLHREAVRRTMK